MARTDGAGPEFPSRHGKSARRARTRRRAIYVFLLLYDRPACPAHDYRDRPAQCHGNSGVARKDLGGKLQSRGSLRPLLAFRGCYLDLSLPFTLSHRRTLQMSANAPSVRTYTLVFLGLLALAGLTTGIAYIDLGPFNTVAALAIAAIK